MRYNIEKESWIIFFSVTTVHRQEFDPLTARKWVMIEATPRSLPALLGTRDLLVSLR